jgi:predicted Zn-dependent peptidase
VQEIYKMGLKHGMKLAAISGASGVFSDEDIAKVRDRALEERARRAKAKGKAAARAPARRTAAVAG